MNSTILYYDYKEMTIYKLVTIKSKLVFNKIKPVKEKYNYNLDPS